LYGCHVKSQLSQDDKKVKTRPEVAGGVDRSKAYINLENETCFLFKRAQSMGYATALAQLSHTIACYPTLSHTIACYPTPLFALLPDFAGGCVGIMHNLAPLTG
jgi:hypothetical protein